CGRPLWFHGLTWLRGLDLNQRPLGYEGKSALHTDQREPKRTSYDGDLRGDEVVPSWFGSVRLLHRDFIAGSESPCGSCPVHCVQHVHPYMAYRAIQISLVEVKLKGEQGFKSRTGRDDLIASETHRFSAVGKLKRAVADDG